MKNIIITTTLVLIFLVSTFLLAQSARGKEYYPFKNLGSKDGQENNLKLYILNIMMLIIGIDGVAGLYLGNHNGNSRIILTVVEVCAIVGTICIRRLFKP